MSWSPPFGKPWLMILLTMSSQTTLSSAMSGLFERASAYWPDDEGRLACAEAAYCELLLSGVTTLVDISGDYPGWIDLIARSGLRGVLAPSYASSRWVVRRSHLLEYEWNEPAGRQKFEAALRLCDEIAKHPSGRLSGMISPAQIDTCTEELLRDSVAAARERELPFTVHCAQAVAEFHEMVRRHGITPIQWAHQIGLAGPGTLLGHALFIDEHSWLHWGSRKDIAIMSDYEVIRVAHEIGKRGLAGLSFICIPPGSAVIYRTIVYVIMYLLAGRVIARQPQPA